MADKPDTTGLELLAVLHRRGVNVSYFGVWHFFERADLSFEKVCTPASKSALMWHGGVRN